MDDVAEKTRRNLMMVSTGILAVWALGIPLDGKLVGAVNLNEVEPWRAWACTLVVLSYFYIRFRRSPTYSSERSKYSREQLEQLRAKCVVVIDASYSAMTSGKKSSVTFILPELAQGYTLGGPVDYQPRGWKSTSPLERQGSMGVDNVPPNGSQILAGIAMVRFTLPRSIVAKLWFQMHWERLRKINWSGLEVTLPTILAYTAAMVCIWKLAESVYCSFPFVRQLLPT